MTLLRLLLAASAILSLASPLIAAPVPGNWIETNALPRVDAASIYDPIRHRFLVFGGFAGSPPQTRQNDLWALELTGSPHWVELHPTGMLPTPRSGQVAVYDPVTDRMIVMAGEEQPLPGNGPTYDDAAWALELTDPPHWTKLATGGPIGVNPSAIYDSRRNRVIVFGGFTTGGLCGTVSDEVWSLALGGTPAWTHLSPNFPVGMPPPQARFRHAAAYDSTADRMVIVGGEFNIGCTFNAVTDVWSLSMDTTLTWSLLSPSGSAPPAKLGRQAAFDAVRNRIVVIGGTPTPDAWTLSLVGGTSWSSLSTSGAAPATSARGTAGYDRASDRMIFFRDRETSALAFPSNAWSALDLIPPLPVPRSQMSSIVDPVRRRLVVFGGNDGLQLRNDVWALSLDPPWHWEELHPSGTPPEERHDAPAVYDPVGDRMVFFGGNGTLQDAWALHFSPSLTWEELLPTGTLPFARAGASAIYDATHGSMVVFGGFDGFSTLLNDVQVLSLGGSPAWTELHPAGSAPARRDHGAIFDPIASRMIVFGGRSGIDRTNEVWSLSLDATPTWSPLAYEGAPPSPREFAMCTYDAVGKQMIVWSGQTTSSGAPPAPDLWGLGLGPSPHWAQLVPTGQGPTGRVMGAIGSDSLANRLVFFGGEDPQKRNDAWLLDLEDIPTPARVALISASSDGGSVRLQWYSSEAGVRAAVYRRAENAGWEWRADLSAGGDGLVSYEDRDVIGGERYGYRLGIADADGMKFFAETWVRVEGAGTFSLQTLHPNPASSRVGISFALTRAEGANLDVLDARGRVILHRDVSALGIGRHELELSTDFAPTAGIYFVRLSQGKNFAKSKLVVLRN